MFRPDLQDAITVQEGIANLLAAAADIDIANLIAQAVFVVALRVGKRAMGRSKVEPKLEWQVQQRSKSGTHVLRRSHRC